MRFIVGTAVLFAFAAYALAVFASDSKKIDTEPTDLLAGDSLNAWKGYQSEKVPAGWVLQDGVLKHESGEVDLVTRETFTDFDLRFEWRIGSDGNSGVIYRCDEGEAASYITGPEYQLVDNQGWQVDARHKEASGALYGLMGPAEDAARPTGEWNASRIVVRQGRVEHWLNDKPVVALEIGSDDWKSRIADTKFANWNRFATLAAGRIALQAHKGRAGSMEPVWFRNITIQRRPSQDASQTANP